MSNVDMSLEDLIKKNKVGRGRGRGRGGRGRGGAKPQGSRGGSARGAFRGAGGRSRSRGRGRSGGAFRGSRGNSMNGRWSHDMYYGGSPAARSIPSGPAKLNITNLDFGVSDSDVKELFSEFGTMRAASVHYDRTGRSLGTAHVIFDRRGDGMKALKQYNGVHLDGRPMKIEVDGAARAATNGVSPVKRLQNSPRPLMGRGGSRGTRRGRGGRGARFSGRGGRGRGGRGARGGASRGQKTKVLTAEELDAELDAYVKEASK